MGNRIGIFGGSFDPVHLGHVKAVESFLRSSIVDEIHILLTPNPPHKDTSKQASYNQRFEMLKLAFDDFDSVRISDLESGLPSPSYTLQTLKYLQNQNTDNLYFLCLGEDGIRNFTSWYGYKEILQLVTLLVAERPGIHHEKIPEDVLERAIFVDHEPVGISSSDVRYSEPAHRENELPNKVAAYILKHQLYIKDN